MGVGRVPFAGVPAPSKWLTVFISCGDFQQLLLDPGFVPNVPAGFVIFISYHPSGFVVIGKLSP
jgi:hypothetical protein